MKKIIFAFSLLLCVTILCTMGACAIENEVAVVLDGETLVFDVPGRLIGDRTMVPLRGIFEALGAEVEWDGATKTVTSTKGDDTVKLTIGKSELYKNGKLHYTMDVVPVIIEESGASRTLVPVRAVAESFGCLVDWDGATRTAILTSTDGGIVLADANDSYYTIVYEEALGEALLGEINSGANIVRYDVGQNMPIFADSALAPAACEIVVGNTNREGSREISETLLPGNYAIKFDPAAKRVFIAGGSLTDISEAIDYFFTTYTDSEKKELRIPYSLYFEKSESSFEGKHIVFYGKSLFDSVYAVNGAKSTTFEYDPMGKQVYTKVVASAKNKPQVMFSQKKSGVNIFSYNYYVVKYSQSRQTSVLSTGASASLDSVKKIYPEFDQNSYERTGTTYPSGTAAEWKTAVINREIFNNSPANALPHPDMTNQILKFKPWGVAPDTDDSYFNIEYIALFEKEADAYKFTQALDKQYYSHLPVEALSIMNNGKDATEINTVVGSEVEFKLNVTPAEALVNVLITSDNPSVVKVENGKLFAIGEGTANVTFVANKEVTDAEIITKTVKINVSGRRFKSVKIDGIDISNFKIVIGENADRTEKYAAYNLADYLNIHLGSSPEVITDKVAESKYEILVGKTNRAASSANITLKDTEFLLYKNGDKVVMQGNGIYVGSAVGEFINTYLEKGSDNVNVTGISASPVVKPTPEFGDEYENVILMIADGMGFNHVNVALANGLDRFVANEFPSKGDCIIHSNSSATTTDSAAAATALATGYKTNANIIGLSPSGEILKNVRELAEENGAQTAVVTNDKITGATPGGFLVHVKKRTSTDEIQAQIDEILARDGIDYIAGGVGKDLIGYTRTALNKISDTEDSFFLMVEETGTDSAGHNNDMATAVTAVTRYDEAITYAVEFVLCHPGTVLIVTADHETGAVIRDENSKYGYRSTSEDHSDANVPVYAIGAGAQVFNGKTIDNTDIAKFIAKAYGAKEFGNKLAPAA